MLNARINTQKIWYALREDPVPVVDENGDFTGEMSKEYGAPKMTRANISPSRGLTDHDIFGLEVNYSNTMSTAKMDLGIDERTLLWDSEPPLDNDGNVIPETAKYRVAAIARGHYHIHYALRQHTGQGGDDE